MEIERDVFSCHWCGDTFPRRIHAGRKPQYCRRTCRQRAYESRRRHALQPDHPAPLVDPGPKRRPPAYESGRSRGIRHALRPDGPVDCTSRRVTLCGTWATPVRPDFGNPCSSGSPCRTCTSLAGHFPPKRRVEPALDVAVLTMLTGRLRMLNGLPLAARQLVDYCWPT